jgi:AcrR family transcriptional regulator
MGQATAHQLHPMLEWVRPPQQARTRKTLNKLLDAAEDLLADKGFDETGIVEIALHAGSSVGGFYRRFRDKQGLLHALHERFCEEARATADVALDPKGWTGASTPDVLGEFVAFLIRIYRRREGLFRVFLRQAMADADVRDRSQRLFDYLGDHLDTLLQGRLADLSHPQPHLAAHFGLQVVLGTLNQIVQAKPQTMGLTDERLPAELARVLLAYLSVEGAATFIPQPGDDA